MKRFLLFTVAVFLFSMISAQVVTCYDIQYTTAASGDSPYINQAVTVQGIVTAPKFYTGTSTSNYGFMICDPEGGPWSGLLVFTNRYFPELGDLVQVTGTVSEYYNFTELTALSAYSVLSQGNVVPAAPLVSCGTLANPATAEQWESCFVKVENVSITSLPANFQEFFVTDGTGTAQIDDQCFERTGFSWPAFAIGNTWARIQGVVDFSFNYYGINPRSMSDIVMVDNVSNSTLSLPTITAELNTIVSMPLQTSRLKPAWGVSSFEAKIGIDPSKVEFVGINIDDCIINIMPSNPEVSADGTEITVTYISQEPITSAEDGLPLFNLQFKPVKYGETQVTLNAFKYDSTPIISLVNGKIKTPIRESIAWLNLGTAGSPKNIFDPALNEKLVIEYGSKTGSSGINAKVNVRIYDAKGRLVCTPVNKVITNALGIETYLYDGRDSNMKRLAPGMYYCSMEIINRETGKKETTTQPIVVRSTMN